MDTVWAYCGMEVEWIRRQVKSGHYFFSHHGDDECQAENLTILEVEESLLRGVILEEYPDAGRGESVLMVGFTNEGKPIHYVYGRRGKDMVIVTTCFPTPPKFKNPHERG